LRRGCTIHRRQQQSLLLLDEACQSLLRDFLLLQKLAMELGSLLLQSLEDLKSFLSQSQSLP
jgi:hypothetical protein